MVNKNRKEMPKTLVENNIDPIDILILNRLYNGIGPSVVNQYIQTERGISISRRNVENRIF